MKRFLFRLFFFCSLQVSLLLVIDYGYSEIMMRSNSRPIESWFDLMHGNIDANVIIMGSSRAWVHYNPRILDSVLCINSYNLGINGSQMNRQIQKYDLYQKYNRKPFLIIQNIDLWSLDYTVGYEREQFFPYFWNRHVRSGIMKTEPFSLLEKYVPLYRYDLLSIPHFSPKSLEKGYHGMDLPWNGKAYMDQDSIFFEPNDTTVKMFDDYLFRTKKQGIKVLFVYTPLFKGAKNKIKNLGEMYSFYQKYADKYDIQILDFMNMDICNDTTYFYNAMHLNTKGSDIFTDSLANSIKRLGILK